ncbi:DUF2829 domain-containing protein [Hymenobacter sp. HMF4947]|uniref:DUF2829 domain-containing protein n=1 Tax=Hymenobacter ginkgonis TaxID=2682976 RepID=A0A7K1TH69_9BACT|nr:MW1434 family type I TA system toxin [Hymenobacter ginkgonis]MVN77748.1 DUF2829 domain-containing protein [Hymenobacter ginkgonis]
MESTFNFPTVTYAQVLEAVAKGLCVARLSWNCAGNYLFMRPADEIPVRYISRASSLPASVRRYLEKRTKGETHRHTGEEITISFGAYLCLVTADLRIVNGWAPSQEDMFATDWIILD